MDYKEWFFAGPSNKEKILRFLQVVNLTVIVKLRVIWGKGSSMNGGHERKVSSNCIIFFKSKSGYYIYLLSNLDGFGY